MPLTKKEFKQRLLQNVEAPSCKLTKTKPPIGPRGCKVRTMQKADGKYHHFRRDGTSYVVKKVESQDVQQLGSFTSEVTGRLVDGKHVPLIIRKNMNIPIIAPFYNFRIHNSMNIPVIFSKLYDSGAPKTGLILSRTEWQSLNLAPANPLTWAQNEIANGNPVMIHRIKGGADAYPTQLVRLILPVEIEINGRWILIKKVPVDVAERNNFVHSNVFGLDIMSILAKYSK